MEKKQNWLEKKFGLDFFKKKIKNKKKDFSDLPTLIFLDMSLETDIIFFLALDTWFAHCKHYCSKILLIT